MTRVFLKNRQTGQVLLAIETSNEPATLTNIQVRTGIDIGNLSRLLGKLKTLGVLLSKKEGRFTIFRVDWNAWASRFITDVANSSYVSIRIPASAPPSIKLSDFYGALLKAYFLQLCRPASQLQEANTKVEHYLWAIPSIYDFERAFFIMLVRSDFKVMPNELIRDFSDPSYKHSLDVLVSECRRQLSRFAGVEGLPFLV